MSAPDPDELARKTLDLWQDQLAALAGDPETGAAMVRLMSMAALGPAALAIPAVVLPVNVQFSRWQSGEGLHACTAPPSLPALLPVKVQPRAVSEPWLHTLPP